MNKKIIYGVLSSLIGYVIFALLIDLSSKASNVALSFKPMESLGTYFFGFGWGMGIIGLVIGAILLFLYLAFFYRLGVWFYKKIQ